MSEESTQFGSSRTGKGGGHSHLDIDEVTGREYIKPYDHMSVEARLLWQEIVRSMPPDAFALCDRTVMENYVMSVLEVRQMEQEARCSEFVLINPEKGTATRNPIFEMIHLN